MIAFEVYVNKVKVCTAGVEDFEAVFGTLGCAINQDGPANDPKMFFSVSGMADKKMFNWVHYNMNVGSKVEIRIVNASKVDKPKRTECPGGSCAT